MSETSKAIRTLSIYQDLLRDGGQNKKYYAQKFCVSEKSIERDLQDIDAFLLEYYNHCGPEGVEYNRKQKCYALRNRSEGFLRPDELYVLLKILMDSRSLCSEELDHMVDCLLNQLYVENKKCVEEKIRNEKFHYVPMQHNRKLVKMIWDLSEAVIGKKTLEITYKRMNDSVAVRTVEPKGIVFSEFYYYLVADIVGKGYERPALYRVDRIQSFEATGEHFRVKYANKFEEGEFKKRIQFMHQGELKRVRFEFYGASYDFILDRLPTARVVEKKADCVVFEAEVYGIGIGMWLMSQGKNMKVLGPNELVEEIKSIAQGVLDRYGGSHA